MYMTSLLWSLVMGRQIGSKSGINRQRGRLQREIGRRIYNTRVERGLSQTTLAERIRSTQQCVSLWEASKTLPDVDTLLSMAVALGVSPSWLAFGEGAP